MRRPRTAFAAATVHAVRATTETSLPRVPCVADSQFASKSDGRDVTRVQSFGCIKVVVDVTLQGMEELGYQVAPPTKPAVRLGMAP